MQAHPRQNRIHYAILALLASALALPASGPEREAFYDLIAGTSAAQVKAYWAKMSFTGKGIPPKQCSSSLELKKFASGKPSAIGYLEENAVDSSVNVLYPPT